MKKKKRQQLTAAFNNYIAAYNDLGLLFTTNDGSDRMQRVIIIKQNEMYKFQMELQTLCDDHESILFIDNLMKTYNERNRQ